PRGVRAMPIIGRSSPGGSHERRRGRSNTSAGEQRSPGARAAAGNAGDARARRARPGDGVSTVAVCAAGGYRYIPAVFQYSSGVAAEPGYRIERARFAEPMPLAEAFLAVERHLSSSGRPLSAFAACELRSPKPYTEQGFREFNE